jgi:glyoxylate reductase
MGGEQVSRIVIANRIPASAVEALQARHDVDYHDSEETITRDELLRRIAGADAVVTLLTEKVDEEFLAAAGDQLKVVANVAVGFNNIDVPACDAHGVVATNTPKVLTETTADTAFGLMLMATRRFGEGERIIRSGTPWQWGMFYLLGMGLQGKTVGIVGMGQIGQAMARRCVAFGMDVVYSDEFELDAATAAALGGARKVSVDELLATADVVSLHCPLMDSTKHLINAESLRKMKRTAYVVNSARGPVVDEAALVDALKSGEIAGAGLDVFENEPAVHPGLLECENVVLLPHLGSATTETRTAMADLAAQNVLALLDGGEAVTPVTKKTRL